MNKMKIVHIHTEYPEHDWKKDRNGEIDEMAMEYEYHNGPVCSRCWHTFCVSCETYEENNGPCVIDEYKCPTCGHILGHNTEYNFCFHCGQALDWSGLNDEYESIENHIL